MFDFVMKQMLKAKLKDVPEAEQKKILEAVDNNPEFFKKLADELHKEVAGGKDQMQAVMTVVKKHEEELRKLMGK